MSTPPSRYRLLEKLGAGGMGEVWLAEDTALRRQVAVKRLPEELTRDPERLRRFEREAQAVAALNHPSIVTIHSIEREGETSFLVMERIDGRPLDRIARSGPLEPERLVDIGVALADALASAHAQGVIHRDLKPANVMITDQGRVKLLDFGLAKLARPDDPELEVTDAATRTALTGQGTTLGTVPYMSPEQVRGDAVDTRSDLFSLGIVLYELAAGRRPFPGDRPAEVMAAILRDRPPPPSDLVPELPAALDSVILRCLEKDPADRYADAAALRDALERVATSPVEPVAGRRAWWRTARGLAAVGMVLAATTVGLWLASGRRAPGPPIGVEETPAGEPGHELSIAVLPFEDLSAEGDMQYFGDGMATEILQALTRLPSLRVAGRSSSFSYRDSDAGIATVAEGLGVETVLEGSIRRSGERLRVSVQLVRARDQSSLWAETWERSFDEDVFDIQDEIAVEVANALRLELGGESGPFAGDGAVSSAALRDQRGTDDAEAYDLYLRGRYRWNQRTRDGVLGAIDTFERALRLDPDFARAWVGLADAYIIASNFAWMMPDDAFPRAREATERALEIAPALADAHVSRAAIASWYDWDPPAAERAFQRALELGPDLAYAHYWYGELLARMNRFEDARREIELALTLDPLALQIRNGLGNLYQWFGQRDRAIAEYRSILALDPGFDNARHWLARALIESGEAQRALELLDELSPAFGPKPETRAWALAVAGRSDEARELARTLLDRDVPIDSLDLLRALAVLDEPETTARVLRRSIDARNYDLPQFAFLPEDSPLRDQPLYPEVLRVTGLAPYWSE